MIWLLIDQEPIILSIKAKLMQWLICLTSSCLRSLIGRAPLSGESEGDLKKSESIGKMCLCKKTQQSRWTRRKYFARMRCVLQEANENRAPSSSMIAKGNAIAVRSANRPSTRVGERC